MKLSLNRFAEIAMVLTVIISLVAFLPAKKDKIYVSNFENVLGTSMEIKIASNNEQYAVKAEEAALAEVDRLDKILSGYDSSSEFRRWMRTDKKPVEVSPELFEVLSLFEQWRIKTNGALDASAETISKLWRDASKQNRLPSSTEIADAVKAVQNNIIFLM